MQAEFRAPRRRTRVREAFEAPLPVSGSSQDPINLRAELINQHVLVCHPDHIKRIHNQGYFGKGVLSRARPDHSISDQWEQHEGSVLPVVSESRYEEMLSWARAALVAQGLDCEAVNQILTELSQPVEMMDVKREAGLGEEGGVCTETLRSPQALHLNHRPDQDRDRDQDQDRDRDQDPEQDQDQDQNPDSDSDSDQDFVIDQDSGSNPDPLVPGPGFVLVCDNEADVRQLRRTPLCMTEFLQLGLEEVTHQEHVLSTEAAIFNLNPEMAFFLVYSLGCLSVYLHQEPLSIIQLWRQFRSLRPDFVSSYAAYHHFRSKGWVPKGGGGAKYGVDLMLYRKGPPFYHASYSVVVERVGDDFSGSALRPFSWRSLAALSRITTNVSKELMLCYIIHPADQSEAELNSPECLTRLRVQEVIVNRWVSSRERAEQDDI